MRSRPVGRSLKQLSADVQSGDDPRCDWYHAWWFYAHSIVRGGIDKVNVGLEIRPAA